MQCSPIGRNVRSVQKPELGRNSKVQPNRSNNLFRMVKNPPWTWVQKPSKWYLPNGLNGAEQQMSFSARQLSGLKHPAVETKAGSSIPHRASSQHLKIHRVLSSSAALRLLLLNV